MKRPRWSARNAGVVAVTVLLAAFLVLLGPMDWFTHGGEGLVDFPEISWIPEEEFGEEILLAEGESFEFQFVPGQKNLSGVFYYLGAQDAVQGTLGVTVLDSSANILQTEAAAWEEIHAPGWNKITLQHNLKQGESYCLRITNEGSELPIRLLTLDARYIPEENVSGRFPVRYCYDVPTFSSQEKILITMVTIALWLLYLAEAFSASKKRIQKAAICLLLTTLLTWNGMYNLMDYGNTDFKTFQSDSEELVTGAIDAYQAGIYSGQPGYALWEHKPAADGASPGFFEPYESQYGLQGAVFAKLSKHIGIEMMHLCCAFAFAVVGMLIVYLILQRYGRLLAGVFYGTLLLSPWTTNFARNLYWVEFTWFIPMAIGLICAWKIHSKRCRWLCYAAAFLALLIKSLCGYEYVSTIMMGLIQFLLVDLILALISREPKKAAVLFKAILGLGVAALTGFVIALMVHAYFKGSGDIVYGLECIYKVDVLRRTNGGNMLDYGRDYANSLDSSIWFVLCRYFRWDTQIITGLDGNLFPLLCMIPLGIFWQDHQKGRLCVQDLLLYLVTFCAPLSWFVLAKAHSVVHPHMNFVLWNFGFVQICFYVILKKLTCLLAGRQKDPEGPACPEKTS